MLGKMPDAVLSSPLVASASVGRWLWSVPAGPTLPLGPRAPTHAHALSEPAPFSSACHAVPACPRPGLHGAHQLLKCHLVTYHLRVLQL